jgi:hypothetical protein
MAKSVQGWLKGFFSILQIGPMSKNRERDSDKPQALTTSTCHILKKLSEFSRFCIAICFVGWIYLGFGLLPKFIGKSESERVTWLHQKCAAACLLRESYGSHGNVIACFELAEGKAKRPSESINEACWWARDLREGKFVGLEIMHNRRTLAFDFVRRIAASFPSLRGAVVFELDDIPSASPSFVAALLAIGIPTLSFNCASRPSYHFR